MQQFHVVVHRFQETPFYHVIEAESRDDIEESIIDALDNQLSLKLKDMNTGKTTIFPIVVLEQATIVIDTYDRSR